MKIVVLDGYALNPGDLSWNGLKSFGNLRVLDRVENNTEKIVAAIGDAEIILTNKTVLTGEILKKVPKVKYIGVLATGYNVVDIGTAKKQGMVVTNVPGYSTNAVAQMTFALLLELTNKVGEHCIAVRTGEWIASKDFSFWKSPMQELYGKTFGVIGFGQIGRAVVQIAQAFGLKVLVHSNRSFRELETETLKFVSRDMLLKESDIISLHCPLTEDTQGIIRKENIKKMKDGVLIINTSRGDLIVEAEIKDALNSGKVGGLAADVISVEPMKKNNPLLEAENCILTPHIAWATKAARERLMKTVINNLQEYLNGNPVNVVNG